MIKISGIKRAEFNGRNVKLFTVRTLIDGSWVFVGEFSAPTSIPNRDLIRFYEENHA